MNLIVFNSDIVQILQLIVSILGLMSLYLVWYQIRQAIRWNRVTNHQMLLGYLPGEELERAVLGILTKYSAVRDTEISHQIAEKLYLDVDAFVAIKSYLNKYEHFCAAINAGAVDEEHAYALHSGRVVMVHDVYRNFIDVVRVKRGPMTYIEIERIAVRWRARRSREEAQLAAELQRLKEKSAVRRRLS